MPVIKQNASINFSQGLDEKTDPWQIPPGKFEALQNTVFNKGGLLQKRNGYQLLPAGTTTGNAISPYLNELLTLDGENLWSLSGSQNTSVNKGTKVSVDISTTAIVRNFYQQTNPDSAWTEGFTVYAWLDSSGGMRYSVIDNETNQSIVNNQLVDSAGIFPPKIKAISNYVLIIYIDSSFNLVYRAISTATPTVLGSKVTIAAAATTDNANFDATVINGEFIVAYNDPSNNGQVLSINSSLTVSSPFATGIGSNGTISPMAVWDDPSNNAWIATYASDEIIYTVINPGLTAAILTPTVAASPTDTIVNITGVYNGSGSVIFYEDNSNFASPGTTQGNLEYIWSVDVTVNGAVTNNAVFMRSVGLASKAFVYNSAIYVTVVHDSTLQPTYFVTDSNGNVIIKLAPSNGGGLVLGGILPEVNEQSSKVFQMPYLYQDTVESLNGTIFTQTGVNSVLIIFGNQTQFLTIANEMHLSGGILSLYDGAGVSEHGFNLYPEGITTTSGYAGGGLGIGSYQYVVTYEWEDNQGNLHRSAPSIPITFNNSNNAIIFSGSSNAAGSYIQSLSFPPIVSGMLIESNDGTLIPDNTYITSITPNSTITTAFLSNAPTMDATDVTFTAIPNYNFLVDTIAGSNVISIPEQVTQANYILSYEIPFPQTNPVVFTAFNPTGLRPGMSLQPLPQPGNTETFFALIQSISGNQLTVYVTAPFPTLVAPLIIPNQIFSASTIEYSVNATNGSPTLTSIVNGSLISLGGTTPPLQETFFSGQTITLGSTPYTIETVGSSTITLTTNYSGSTGTVTQVVSDTLAAYALHPGQAIVSIDGTTVPEGDSIAALTITTSPTVPFTATATLAEGEFAQATETNLQVSTPDIAIVQLQIPTLRITNKPPSQPVSIVVYRTTANGTTFYRVSSLTDLTFNDKSVDYVTVVDFAPDDIIIGNEILYTTGGVVDDISAPATSIMTTYKSRCFLVDAETPNLLWFSKQVIQATPVEFSDLFTIYVAPTVSAQPNASPVTALSAMDDKLIIFKSEAIYYMTGNGPDNTGANSDFSDPTYVISPVGCANQNSIVSMPQGLMFQSVGKGIWLLGRDLSTSYIGAPVESNNDANVTSASNVPGTNQVRFTLDNGITLMYDYYYQQWGQFDITGVSGTIFQGLHTLIDASGIVSQELPGSYLDATNPVLMSFTTAWFSLNGLQGYQRIYYFLLLGKYLSPHFLNLGIAYDFDPNITQSIDFNPNITRTVEQERFFLTKMHCQSFQYTLTESYNPAYGIPAGAGLTLSGMNLVYARKRGWRPMPGVQSTG